MPAPLRRSGPDGEALPGSVAVLSHPGAGRAGARRGGPGTPRGDAARPGRCRSCPVWTPRRPGRWSTVVLAAAPTGRALTVAEAGRVLAAYGLPLVERQVVVGPAAAAAAADELGYPVAVKATAPSLRHRQDLGAVRLDLADCGGGPLGRDRAGRPGRGDRGGGDRGGGRGAADGAAGGDDRGRGARRPDVRGAGVVRGRRSGDRAARRPGVRAGTAVGLRRRRAGGCAAGGPTADRLPGGRAGGHRRVGRPAAAGCRSWPRTCRRCSPWSSTRCSPAGTGSPCSGPPSPSARRPPTARVDPGPRRLQA